MNQAEPVAATASRSSIRWIIWILILFGTAINFGDRAVLGAVAPALIKALHLTLKQYGVVASAFSWGYTPVQLIAGIIVARLGPRRTWMSAMALWSVFVMLTPLAPTFGLLLLFRLLFGMAEGSNFPSAGAVVGAWFPAGERNFGLSPNGLGEALGLILFIPATVALAAAFGWRAPFFVLGGISILWIIFAAIVLTDRPDQSRFVSSQELAYIRGTETSSTQRSSGPSWARILTNRTVWGGAVSLFANAYLIYVALSFVPLYLVKQYHIPQSALAGLAVWPWVASAIGALLGGRLSDAVYRRTRDIRMARGFLGGGVMVILAAVLYLVTTVGANPTAAVVVVSIAMFLDGFANIIYFAVPVDVSPREPARTSGLIIGFASASGMVAPVVTAFTVAQTGSFNAAFLVAAAIALIGAVVSLAFVRNEDIMTERAA